MLILGLFEFRHSWLLFAYTMTIWIIYVMVLHGKFINLAIYGNGDTSLPWHWMRCVLDTTLCNKVCQWFTAGRWFSPGIPNSSPNKIDHHDITEILLQVELNTKTNPSLTLCDRRKWIISLTYDFSPPNKCRLLYLDLVII